MTTSIEAAYEGSFCIRMAGELHCIGQDEGGGVLPRAARKLLAQGSDPATPVHVTRDGTRVFKDAPLSAWAGITVEEPDDAPRSARIRTFRPHSSKRPATKCGGLLPIKAPDSPSLALAHP